MIIFLQVRKGILTLYYKHPFMGYSSIGVGVMDTRRILLVDFQ